MKIAKNKFDVLVFDQIFPLPQVRWSVIIINKHDMYDLTSRVAERLKNMNKVYPTAFSPMGGLDAHTRKKYE